MLDAVNPFADVAANVPEFSADKGHVTIAAVGVNFRDGRDGFVLMASLMNPADRSSGSAEEDVQDHDCRILGQTVLVPR
jgi:CDP-diacylglycerol pyrophosphatase